LASEWPWDSFGLEFEFHGRWKLIAWTPALSLGLFGEKIGMEWNQDLNPGWLGMELES